MRKFNIIICCFIMAISACGNTKANPKDTEQTADVAIETIEKQGTVFFDLTFEKALEKAKAENKFVLANFHTKTCGPCRKMEKTVFPDPVCGEYINKNFVPIIIDGEDNGIGEEIAKKYKIFIFPTYLILQPDGFKEGEISGAEFDIDKFLDMLKSIIRTE